MRNPHIMKKYLLFLLLFSEFSFAEENVISRSEYIASWKLVAVEQMNLHGIPASITMAQGILESGNGNSKLAKEGKNHFGIKCHGWEGEKMYLDDDAKDECFRVYADAKDSYLDHSEFLKKYKRYEFLFSYKSTDYKSWAEGLKDAGYATNPSYAESLIKLIEDEKLFELDKEKINPETILASKIQQTFSTHSRHTNQNGTNYIIVRKGDTFFKISQEIGISMSILRRFNDFHSDREFLLPGEKIYIEPKARKSKKEKYIILDSKKTMRDISQEKGIRLKSLVKKNNTFTPDQQLPKGTKVFLK
jgi:LysM repeat protein